MIQTNITCGAHYDHEDTLSHSKSALWTQRLENPLRDTLNRDLQVILLLQAQGRYKA